MTSQEKSDIYNLLKKAGSSVLGCEMAGFSSEITFADDIVQSVEAVSSIENEVPSRIEICDKPVSKLESIAEKIRSCKNCQLCQTRLNCVPGEGVEKPFVLVVGEGPGEEEDKTGRPFVGKAGQLLDKMLAAINLGRTSNCFIANIVKCRPPSNRTPFPQEADACSGYLQAQIHALKPSAILAMGRTAAQNLLKTDSGINALRGKIFDYNGIPFMATYHPSALLRDEDLKRPAWNDLKVFRETLTNLNPDYGKDFLMQKNSQPE